MSRRRIGANAVARLLAGMVVTIEPGVYLAGRFGIRTKEMAAVTRNGGGGAHRRPRLSSNL